MVIFISRCIAQARARWSIQPLAMPCACSGHGVGKRPGRCVRLRRRQMQVGSGPLGGSSRGHRPMRLQESRALIGWAALHCAAGSAPPAASLVVKLKDDMKAAMKSKDQVGDEPHLSAGLSA